MGRVATTKRCNKCRKRKPLSGFYWVKYKDGRVPGAYCKKCELERAKRYDAKYPVQRRRRQRDWHRRNRVSNPDLIIKRLTTAMWRAVRAGDWDRYDELRADWFRFQAQETQETETNLLERTAA